jgi:hypothetical protein
VFLFAHVPAGLRVLPLRQSRISDAPPAGPQRPATTQSTKRPNVRRNAKGLRNDGLPETFALVDTIAESAA